MQSAYKYPAIEPCVWPFRGCDFHMREGIARPFSWGIIDGHAVVDCQHGAILVLHLVQRIQFLDAIGPQKLPVSTARQHAPAQDMAIDLARKLAAHNRDDEAFTSR